MDPRRFDSFTQTLATAKTRRGLIGGIIALVAGVRAAGQASATILPCPIPGQILNRKGECNCPAGQSDICPGVGCVSKRSDPNNCGSCGNVCAPWEDCRKGECRCSDGSQDCGGCTSSEDCGPGFICIEELGICTSSSGSGMVFNATAAEVWQALTDGETLTSLGISSDIAPVVGHRFQIRPAPGAGSVGPIEAEMVEVEAPSRFVFRWLNGPLDEPTTVTVTLDPAGDGSATRFRLAHTDRTGKACLAGARVLGRNWGQRLFHDALPQYLAQKR